MEEALEPGLPIIDAHHHLLDPEDGRPYLLPEFLADARGGHDVVATVLIESGAMHRAEGPPEYRPVGETEFLCGMAAMAASGRYGPVRVGAGIVGRADLTLDAVQPVLEAHIAASGGRFRGVRMLAAWDPSYRPAHWKVAVPPGLLAEPTFRRGFARLAPNRLSYDAMVFFRQIPELAALARAFPETVIVANQMLGPVGLGPYADRTAEVFAIWKSGVEELARCPNVFVKLAGMRQLGVALSGDAAGDRDASAATPASATFARAWRPYVETCVANFGAERCMFASNFPPERALADYVTLWNAFKRVSADGSAAERAALFGGSAATAYRLPQPAAPSR